MPKLPSVRAREVVRIAIAVGFALDRQRGSHALYMRPSDNRRSGIITDPGLTPDEFARLLG